MGEISNTSGRQSADPGERRQVSVLFADMVNYTAITSELGEEKTLDFVRMIYDLLSKTVMKHGGTVRDFAGDGIMALFGVPDALEHAALLACRAALSINESLADAGGDIEAQFGVRPNMRVGVSSGNVLVAAVSGTGSPATAVGSTVNLASRIEGLAPPGGTLICDNTRRLVEWLTDLRFEGEHRIKGLTKPQKLWKLQSIRSSATRFDASLARGLSNYVGRAGELSQMSKALTRAKERLSVIDLVAEPGLGKTRLVFEFLQNVSPEDAAVIRGHCLADGQQVPFLPFLEIVRSSFRLRDDDDPMEIAAKIDAGLRRSRLYSDENQAILMNLLGLKHQSHALDGLDGVLIGLRTRDLLPALLKEKCLREKVILWIEDVHWIDHVSEDLLGKLIESGEQANLLIIQTRRPEYVPGWLGCVGVETIGLRPLTSENIAHIAQTRLGVDELPQALTRQLTERAGGNPLFGEEILSYLIDRGALQINAGKADFDAAVGQSGLPASMRDLLAARLEQLEYDDRELLQAAAVIGRHFDPGLLSQLVKRANEIGTSLERLQELGIVYREANSSDYTFKHVLLRDSVYQSLVSARRLELHLAVAEGLKLRNANRLEEVAETLAHHYGQTDQTDQAFVYTVLAGMKCLGTYSLDEADRYFVSALEVYDRDPQCARPDQFAELLASFALCSNISLRVTGIIDLAERARPILETHGDSRHHALFLHHYVSCMVCNGKYREAHNVQNDLSAMAERLGDPETKAYAMVNELSVSIYHAPIANDLFEAKAREIEAVLEKIDDAYIQNFFLATIGWNELTRGRVAKAHSAADRMIALGKSQNDPRSLGYGTAMKALIAMVTDDHELALKMAEEARRASKVEFELAIAEASRVASLVPLEKPGAFETVQRHIDEFAAKGLNLFTAGPETMLGLAYALNGDIARGLKQIEDVIERRDAEGTGVAADWARLFLCEVYLAILSGEGGSSIGVLLRNLRSIGQVMIFGEKRTISMLEQIRQNPQFDDRGHYIARCDMILGLLHKARKRPELARRHLSAARIVVETAGRSPMLSRIDAALSELV
ncbi:MAG: AAA family ATPase [Paracoccaceae bacterium]